MAATFDAKSASQNGIAGSATVTFAHTVAADATVLLVVVAYWSNANHTDGALTGVTWNGGAMTLIGSSARSNGEDIVSLYFLPGPTTGAHNIVASFGGSVNNNNVGSVYGVSFKGTPTAGGSGVVWADFTSAATSVNAANSSITVPNNTSNDGLIDAVAIGANVTPTMGTQTNRTLGASGGAAAGEGEGWSYLVPGPSGNQVMNWTFASNSSSKAGVRVLGVAVAAGVVGELIQVKQAVNRASTY